MRACQARSREEARFWIEAVRAVAASVNPLLHPWGVPGEVACLSLRNVATESGREDLRDRQEDRDDIQISAPFNFQHIASGAAAAVGAAAAAVGGVAGVGAGDDSVEVELRGGSKGSHYKEIETKVTPD